MYRATAEVRRAGVDRDASTDARRGGADLEMTDPRLNERARSGSRRRRAARGQPGEMTELADQLRAAVPAARRRPARSLAQRLVVCGDRRAAGGRVDPAAAMGTAVRRRTAQDCVAPARYALVSLAIARRRRAIRRPSPSERYALIVAGRERRRCGLRTAIRRWTPRSREALVERMKFDRARVTVLRRHADRRRDRRPPTTCASIGAPQRDDARRSPVRRPDRPRHVRRRRRQVQPRRTGPGIGGVGRAPARHARPAWCRQHDVGELSVHRAPRRAAADRHHRDRFGRAAVRHGVSRVLRQGVQEDAADIDKNDRISIWEAFTRGGGRCGRHYQRRGQLATERPLLDDNGDGVGREAAAPGRRRLAGEPAPTSTSAARRARRPTKCSSKLLQKRAALEADLEELKVRRSFLPRRVSAGVRAPDDRARARQREIRARVKS